MKIEYVVGDATAPQGEGMKYIVHICNDIGGWGKGFVMAISKRWKQPALEYRKWAKELRPATLPLGQIQFVKVEDNLYVVNMIAQKDTVSETNPTPIKYDALRTALTSIAIAAGNKASVHMPRIGCGLAGGTWGKVEPIVHEELTLRGVPVTVYDLK